MKNIILFLSLFLFNNTYSQKVKKLSFLVGAKLRVTPLYTFNPEYLVISVSGNLNAVQQPDYHLSGLGLFTTQTCQINNEWLINFQQTTRYDVLYKEWPLDGNLAYKIKDKKRLIFDLNVDVGRRFKNKKNEFTALLGMGISGLNTGYTQIIRQYSTTTDYIDYKQKINFLFPTISAGFGWQKGKFLTQAKMGYCWKNPTWTTYPFFFPELSLQYKIK
jgi:hypothetical protein